MSQLPSNELTKNVDEDRGLKLVRSGWEGSYIHFSELHVHIDREISVRHYALGAGDDNIVVRYKV